MRIIKNCLAFILCLTISSEFLNSSDAFPEPHDRTLVKYSSSVSNALKEYCIYADYLTLQEVNAILSFEHKLINPDGKEEIRLKDDSHTSPDLPPELENLSVESSYFTTTLTNTSFWLSAKTETEQQKFPDLTIESLRIALLKHFGSSIYSKRIDEFNRTISEKPFWLAYETRKTENSPTTYKGFLIITSIDYGKIINGSIDNDTGLSTNSTYNTWCQEMIPYDFLTLARMCWGIQTLSKGVPAKDEDTRTVMNYYGYDRDLSRYITVSTKRIPKDKQKKNSKK